MSEVTSVSEAERLVLASLSPLERWAFRKQLHSLLVHGSRKMLESGGAVWSAQLTIASQLVLLGGATAFLGVGFEGIAANSHGPMTYAPEALCWVVGGLMLALGALRIHTASRARREFVRDGHVAFSLPPPPAEKPPPSVVIVIAVGLFTADLVFIAVSLLRLRAKYSAPQVTGVFFLALSLAPLSGFVALAVTWVRRRGPTHEA